MLSNAVSILLVAESDDRGASQLLLLERLTNLLTYFTTKAADLTGRLF